MENETLLYFLVLPPEKKMERKGFGNFIPSSAFLDPAVGKISRKMLFKESFQCCSFTGHLSEKKSVAHSSVRVTKKAKIRQTFFLSDSRGVFSHSFFS